MTPAATSPTGRRVLVTGAAGGIGRSVVAALAEAGCTVAACDQPGSAVASVSGATLALSFDVRDREAVRRGVAQAIDEMGGCDAIVAGAGIVDTIHRAERFSEEAWRSDLETNLSGAFYVAQAAFDALAASGDGRIVVIASVAAEAGLPGQVAYAASKAGLLGMARTLAGEWASRGVRCNVVMPGMIATPKVLSMPDGLQASLKASIPLRRFGATEELAGAVTFLLSDAAAYMTGSVLRIDGGLGLSAGPMR